MIHKQPQRPRDPNEEFWNKFRFTPLERARLVQVAGDITEFKVKPLTDEEIYSAEENIISELMRTADKANLPFGRNTSLRYDKRRGELITTMTRVARDRWHKCGLIEFEILGGQHIYARIAPNEDNSTETLIEGRKLEDELCFRPKKPEP